MTRICSMVCDDSWATRAVPAQTASASTSRTRRQARTARGKTRGTALNLRSAGDGSVLDLHRAGALRRAQVLVRSKNRLHGKNMHTLIAEKIWSCLKERMIIFDRSGPAQTAGLQSARKSCLSRNFPAAFGPRGHGPGSNNHPSDEDLPPGIPISYYPSNSLPERTGLGPFCIPSSSGSIPFRRGQTAQGTPRAARNFARRNEV